MKKTPINEDSKRVVVKFQAKTAGSGAPEKAAGAKKLRTTHRMPGTGQIKVATTRDLVHSAHNFTADI